jgi:hypothetical protein
MFIPLIKGRHGKGAVCAYAYADLCICLTSQRCILQHNSPRSTGRCPGVSTHRRHEESTPTENGRNGQPLRLTHQPVVPCTSDTSASTRLYAVACDLRAVVRCHLACAQGFLYTLDAYAFVCTSEVHTVCPQLQYSATYSTCGGLP